MYNDNDKKRFILDPEQLVEVSFDAIQDGISVLDLDFTILRVNRIMEEWYGQAMPIKGKKCFEVYQGLDQPCSRCPSLRVMQNGKPASDEVPLFQEGRQTGWLELYAYPIKDHKGSTVGVVEFVRDITARSKVEQELQAERAQLLSIFDSIDEIVYVSDPETFEVLYVNKKMREVFSGEVIGKKCYRVLQDREEPCEFCTNDIIFGNRGEPYRWEHYNPVVKRTYSITDRVIKWSDGRDVRFEIAFDITARKKVEQALEQSREWYRTLIKAMPDIIILYSAEGHYLDVSLKSERELIARGRRLYRDQSLIGSSVYDVLEPFNADKVLSGIKETLRTGQLQLLELSFAVEGGQRDYEARMVPAGQNKVMSIVRNMTAEKKTEKALEYQFHFEKIVADISSAFVAASGTDIDNAINHALQLSGEFFGADRSYLCRFSEDGLYMDNTHEWCAPGVPSMKDRNQGFPLDKTPWWSGQLKEFKHVYVPDVDALPPEAEKDLIDFKAEGTRSFLTIPMVNDDRVIGFFGFKVVREKKYLTENQVAMLKVIAEIITGAIARNEAVEALAESEIRYRDILDTMEEAYYETDMKGNITFFNQAGLKLFGGYGSEEAQGISYNKLYKEPGKAFKAFNRVFSTGEPDKGLVLEMVRKDGSCFYGEISIALLKDREGYVKGFKGIGKDVTDRIEHENRLKYLSMHDQLTGIYNRAYFETELSRHDRGRDYPVTIISADLDGLKLVNDTIGHDAGDRLLQGCAMVLKEVLRGSDVLARVGGDEFSAILPRMGKRDGENVVRRIREGINDYNLENEELPLGLSVGVATAEKEDMSLKELFKRADDMMYRDKLYSSRSSRSMIVQSLLAALAERDYITEGHARRLEELCRAVGERIELSSHQLADLALLAQVHDLGKVGIPDTILFKPGPLTDEEWEVMRGHPEKGYRIASSSTDLAGVAELILKHHERWDGEGYPLGLKGKEIPVECRILAIVDAFDAMTSQRPYNRTKTPGEAVEEIKENAGSQFDPFLVEVFFVALKDQPRYKELPGS